MCLCVCLWLRPQASKCHQDRDQQKFGSVSDVTPTTPPTPSAGLRGRAWVKCRQSKTHAEGEREMGHSWNRFLGDEDFNSKRRLRWSGRSSAGEGESAGQHQTSYTWVTHAPYRRTVHPTIAPTLPTYAWVNSVSHAWPVHLRWKKHLEHFTNTKESSIMLHESKVLEKIAWWLFLSQTIHFHTNSTEMRSVITFA